MAFLIQFHKNFVFQTSAVKQFNTDMQIMTTIHCGFSSN